MDPSASARKRGCAKLRLRGRRRLPAGHNSDATDTALLEATVHTEVNSSGKSPRPARRRLSAGARLIREWQGRTFVVDVTDSGYLFEGKEYRSLTAIALQITGVQWSGPRFFGL